ncbi:MAG: lipid A biosynthesis acyltransferase [Betaproteobacteria bacterium]
MADNWRTRRERGSVGMIRLIIWLALHAGRALCRVLLVPICFYFLVTAPSARRSSQDFLTRARQHPAGWHDTFMHLFVFATTLLDRVFLLHGRRGKLEISVTNEAVFWDALAGGRGCLLMGSHLGSFEMLGVIGSEEKHLAVNMVMHVDEDARLARLIRGKDMALPYRVIPLGNPGSMLQVKECMDRGEVVGILADRVFADEPTQSVSFLGSPARFSLSPLRLARITGVPVVTVFGIFRGANKYEIVFELLAQRVGTESLATSLPADDVDIPVNQCLATYVSILEQQARLHPYNWFNFYDYWSA